MSTVVDKVATVVDIVATTVTFKIFVTSLHCVYYKDFEKLPLFFSFRSF